jgi:hypothetical protein
MVKKKKSIGGFKKQPPLAHDIICFESVPPNRLDKFVKAFTLIKPLLSSPQV